MPHYLETPITVQNVQYPTHYDLALEYGVPWNIYTHRVISGESPEDIVWPFAAHSFDPLSPVTYEGNHYASLYELAAALRIDYTALYWLAYSNELNPTNVDVVREQDALICKREKPKLTPYFAKFAVQGRPFASKFEICRAFNLKSEALERLLDQKIGLAEAVSRLLGHHDLHLYDSENSPKPRRDFLKAHNSQCQICKVQPLKSLGLFIHPLREDAPRVTFAKGSALDPRDYEVLCHYCTVRRNFKKVD
jgi:hypothetical protein